MFVRSEEPSSPKHIVKAIIMTEKYRKSEIPFLITLLFSMCNSMTVNEMENLTSTVFSGYNKKLSPLLNQSDTIYVNMTIAVVSIDNVDELSGIVSLCLIFNMQWMEERLSWNPDDHGGKSSMLVDLEDMWSPKLFILKAANRIDVIGHPKSSMRLNNNGVVFWSIAHIVQSTCSIDVTYFPYDVQNCGLLFGTPFYPAKELTYRCISDRIDLSYFTENNEWELLDASETYSFVYPVGHSSIVVLRLIIERRVLFYVIYIILPLFVLSLLNIIVFGMPASSGERLSVAVTIFLSFVVFMNSVNQYVPESSRPLSILYYFLLYLILYSSCIMFLCVLSLRIYARSGGVSPRWIVLIKCLRFWYSKSEYRSKLKKDGQNAILATVKGGNMKGSEVNEFERSPAGEEFIAEEMTWLTVGETFDIYCAVLLFVGHLTFSSVCFHNLRK